MGVKGGKNHVTTRESQYLYWAFQVAIHDLMGFGWWGGVEAERTGLYYVGSCIPMRCTQHQV